LTSSQHFVGNDFICVEGCEIKAGSISSVEAIIATRFSFHRDSRWPLRLCNETEESVDISSGTKNRLPYLIKNEDGCSFIG
jgi:hypothetical protein